MLIICGSVNLAFIAPVAPPIRILWPEYLPSNLACCAILFTVAFTAPVVMRFPDTLRKSGSSFLPDHFLSCKYSYTSLTGQYGDLVGSIGINFPFANWSVFNLFILTQQILFSIFRSPILKLQSSAGRTEA